MNNNTATLIISKVKDLHIELDAQEYENLKQTILPEKQNEIYILQAKCDALSAMLHVGEKSEITFMGKPLAYWFGLHEQVRNLHAALLKCAKLPGFFINDQSKIAQAAVNEYEKWIDENE